MMISAATTTLSRAAFGRRKQQLALSSGHSTVCLPPQFSHAELDLDDTDWDLSCIMPLCVFSRLEGNEACEIVKIGPNTTAHELCKHKRQCRRPYWESQLLQNLGKSGLPMKFPAI